jgi:thiol-disulfide isomerase/thioredoxin
VEHGAARSVISSTLLPHPVPNMSIKRPHRILSAVLLSGSVVLSPACATHTKPAAVPAPTPPAAGPLLGPAGPAPKGGYGVGAYRPAPAPLLGHLTREEIRAYDPWKRLFDEPYVPDAAAVATIRANADGIAVLLIVATWCPDSRREVPRFFAIMDDVGIRESQLTMVGVDRAKKDTEGLTEKWGVTRVPTFVFLRDGQEVGRVVERTPAGATLEGEIARALAPRL